MGRTGGGACRGPISNECEGKWSISQVPPLPNKSQPSRLQMGARTEVNEHSAPSPYDEGFYHEQLDGSIRSARQVVPLVVQWFAPQSVIDVGCGTGAWLSAFRERGITDIIGVDGGWIDPGLLRIPSECFLSADLAQPLRLTRQFDLVLSVEVAEHLPADCAESFVESLVCLGPVVLFSAAIPHQGGENHVNLQWPDYWISRFDGRGYRVIDCIRRRIWNNAEIEWWYAQNMMLFVRHDYVDRFPELRREL
jgi:SAM-dependent methyltransferase